MTYALRIYVERFVDQMFSPGCRVGSRGTQQERGWVAWGCGWWTGGSQAGRRCRVWQTWRIDQKKTENSRPSEETILDRPPLFPRAPETASSSFSWWGGGGGDELASGIMTLGRTRRGPSIASPYRRATWAPRGWCRSAGFKM